MKGLHLGVLDSSLRSQEWHKSVLVTLTLMVVGMTSSLLANDFPRFGLIERSFKHAGSYQNAYTEMTALATLVEPNGKNARTIPLFWDGGSTWKFRFAPDKTGTWMWSIESQDKGLNGQAGEFRVTESSLQGSIRPMKGHTAHFERQDGSPFWFMGDTAWALFTDSKEEKHDRGGALHYIDTRAAQGFNVLHSMLLSEAGWGNQNGLPFDAIADQRLNPGYWQEMDFRLAYLNSKGMVGGLAIAWGDKRGEEPFAWKRLPTLEARKRYARYIAARYSAYDVYFLVSGEWHGEIRTTPGVKEGAIKEDFIAIGNALKEADPHGRMIGIHPMTRHGSVREFINTSWMSFGDYQQNYRDLHERVLLSRWTGRPVINSEYGYYLRDSDGNGIPDKDNSYDVEDMRQATWDIVMASGYFITGFGTTYFGGNRDPGSFDVDTAKNDVWETQVGHVKKLFTGLKWWKLNPADSLLTAKQPREGDRTREIARTQGKATLTRPPATTYWALADHGDTYVVYSRGLGEAMEIRLDAAGGSFKVRQFNPRAGAFQDLGVQSIEHTFQFTSPDRHDWVVVLERQ